MNPIQFLKQQAIRNRGLTEEDIIKIHDILMVEYGWIPLEEFKELPIPTLFSLMNCVKERKEKEQRQYRKVTRR